LRDGLVVLHRSVGCCLCGTGDLLLPNLLRRNAYGRVLPAGRKLSPGRRERLRGLGRRMPWTMAAFVIGGFSLIGVPLTAGFISKWYLVLGTMEANQTAMLFVLLGSSLLNAAYFLPIVYKAFFCTPEESMFEDKVQEAPLWCVVPLVITAIVSIGLFFYPDLFRTLAEIAVGVK